jgi:hypothetical protein
MQIQYWKRASKRFLKGTQHKSPCEAVEAGARTLADWARILEEERNEDLAQRTLQTMRRTSRVKANMQHQHSKRTATQTGQPNP